MRSKAGFTLIELMVVVAILAILAAVAIPAFSLYVRRSRAAEASVQLKNLFDRAAVYYVRERADPGLTGEHRVDCRVEPDINDITPNDTKQPGDYSRASWRDLGYAYAFGYYQYVIANDGGRCSIPANTTNVYTFRAIGDLDNDGANSTFELAVGSNGENELFHQNAVYIVNEAE